MRKLAIAIVLLIMAVFSLSAEEVLKTRYVNNIYEGKAKVCLISDEYEAEVGTVTDYYAVWYERDGSDIINAYECDSIEQAFNVWLMSRDKIESKRQIVDESVEEVDGEFYLLRIYELK